MQEICPNISHFKNEINFVLSVQKHIAYSKQSFHIYNTLKEIVICLSNI